MSAPRNWRTAEPECINDVVAVSGGGHGLSTAYYVAMNHGISDICMLQKAWLAGGEAGPLARPYSLERFTTGALIDEHGAAGVAPRCRHERSSGSRSRSRSPRSA